MLQYTHDMKTQGHFSDPGKDDIMIKKTVKRSLAFTLAASLAFGAAPISGFAGVPKVAQAAETAGTYTTAKSITLTTGTTNYFELGNIGTALTGFVGSEKLAIKLNENDKTIAGIALSESPENWLDKIELARDTAGTPKIYVKGLKAGTATIKLVALDGSNNEIASSVQNIDVSVSDLVKNVIVKDKDSKALDDLATISMVNKKTAEVSVELNNISADGFGVTTDYTAKGIYVEDTGIATAAYANNKITFTGVKAGTTKVYIYIPTENIRRQFTLSVAEDTVLSATLDGATYSIGTDKKWTKENKVVNAPVIYLNNSAKTAQINAVSSNGKPVTFSSTGDIVVGSDGSISAKLDAAGKVTTGNAKVTFGVAGDADKNMSPIEGIEVNVVITSDPVKVAKVEAFNSENKSLGKSEGSFTVAGDTVTGVPGVPAAEADQAVIKLSTKDKTSETFTIESNIDEKYVDITVKSGSEFIKLEGKTITAVKKGSASIEVKAKGDESTLSNATATVVFKVEVLDKNVNNVITASPIFLNKDKLTDTIKASATHGNKLSYYLAKEVDGKLVATDKDSDPSYDVTVNKLTGEVTYKNTTRSGFCYIAVVAADDVADSVKPEDAFVKVTYGDYVKKASDLAVASAKISVKAGESVSCGATSTQELTYTSDDEAVATVASDGTITGVSAGTAVITIKAAANDEFNEGEKSVTVVVSKNANTLSAKGKSVKVSLAKLNKKDQKVKASAAVKVAKAVGKVTYVKKSGNKAVKVAKNGKITVKKGLKKGTYKVKVTVKAAGNASYNKASKTVTVKIVVK